MRLLIKPETNFIRLPKLREAAQRTPLELNFNKNPTEKEHCTHTRKGIYGSDTAFSQSPFFRDRTSEIGRGDSRGVSRAETPWKSRRGIFANFPNFSRRSVAATFWQTSSASRKIRADSEISRVVIFSGAFYISFIVYDVFCDISIYRVKNDHSLVALCCLKYS